MRAVVVFQGGFPRLQVAPRVACLLVPMLWPSTRGKNANWSQYFWTSTTDAADTGEAWTVFSCDFGVYDTPKSNVGYTLAVR
jgi:hypothetical protein